MPSKLTKTTYETSLRQLQRELVYLQEWVKSQGLKVAVIFEGRDASGKGGAIKRITEPLNPRVCRIVALGVPTEREKSQWYFQRYVPHLPAAGEMVLFDRSWYNRAGVERVMGFCTDEEYEEFLRSVPLFEEMLIRSGIVLIKYWFSVVMKCRRSASKSASKNQKNAGNLVLWIYNPDLNGSPTAKPKTSCLSKRALPRVPGMW